MLGSRAAAIISFYAFYECDTVSAFGGKVNMSAWQTLDLFPDVIDVVARFSFVWRQIHGHHRSICLHHVRQNQHLLLTRDDLNLLSGRSALMMLSPLQEVFSGAHRKRSISRWAQTGVRIQQVHIPSHEHWVWMKEKQAMTVGNQNGLLWLHLDPCIRNFWKVDAKNAALLITVNDSVLAYLERVCVLAFVR